MGWEGSRLLLPEVHLERLFVEGSTKGLNRDSSLTAVPRLALKPSSDSEDRGACECLCVCINK